MHKCTHENCERSYKDKRDLQDHLRSKKHDPDKLLALTCDQCSDTFRARVCLRQHRRRVHEEAKPKFKCDQCDYTAYQSNNLTRHKRAVHQGIKTKFKNKKCPLCETVMLECDIARHIRHNCSCGDLVRVQCRFCEQTYANESSRDDHEYAMHHVYRPWCCRRCNRAYSYRSQASICCP